MKKLFAILAAVALLGLAMPVLAADAPGTNVVVGGRMLTDVGYQSLTKELTSNKKEDVGTSFVNLAGHSYLHAKFTSADKSTGGFVELGLSSKQGNSEGVSLRYAYGWWKMGNCKLVAGHIDGWIGTLKHAPKQYLGLSQSAKLLMSNWGYIYSGRHPQARFEWMKDNMGFSLAVVQPLDELTPQQTYGLAQGSTALPSTVDVYSTIPRFDLAAQFTFGGLWIGPGIGWSQFRIEKGYNSMKDDTVTSFVAILPVKFTMGPFTAKAEVHWGQNNEYDWNGINSGLKTLPRSVAYRKADGAIEDTRNVGGFLALEYNLTSALQATAGYGIEYLQNDAWKKDAGYQNDDYRRQMFFVAFPYTITKNFSIHPEFNYYNYGDALSDNKDNGNEWMLGLQFRFVF